VSDGPLHTHRYETVGTNETLSVELPDGIGVVHIRTGSVQGVTGNPMIAVEVVSDTLDTPAGDSRYYQAEYNSTHETIFLVGHPDNEQTLCIHCSDPMENGRDLVTGDSFCGANPDAPVHETRENPHSPGCPVIKHRH
jgi:hypothetical protein